MELNNASEMIADLKVRQLEMIKDNHSESDSSSEHSDKDIVDDDIYLNLITNDEIISVSEVIDNQTKADIF